MDAGFAQERLVAPQDDHGLDAEPEREENAQQVANAGRLGRLHSSRHVAIALVCGLVLLGAYTSLFAVNLISGPRGAPSTEPKPTRGSDAAQPVVQLRYISFHPFNLLYHLSLQTIFGLPGETAGRLPWLYSSYELEVVLRTVNSSGAPARNCSADGGDYVTQQPAAAHMYVAALLTVPRSAVVHSWLYDSNGAFKLIREARVDVLASLNKLSFGLLGRALRRVGFPKAADSDKSYEDSAAQTSNRLSSGTISLGLWLWPLALLCPGVLTCFLALAAVETAPVGAAWVVLTGLVRAGCEVRVLSHAALLLWRRRPQAAVQCLACSHGVPFMLGCHAVLLLRLAMALLPARVFTFIVLYMYGTWAPLASVAVMLLALRPNNGHLLEGAMDNILHLGHRAVEDLHPAAPHADVPTVTVNLRARKHWPPPVKVPAELQENAESAPRHMLCSITHHILTEPAVTSTGATYERSAIVEWLRTAGKDPLTGHAVSVDEVFPNLVMYSVIEEYVREASRAPVTKDQQ